MEPSSTPSSALNESSAQSGLLSPSAEVDEVTRGCCRSESVAILDPDNHLVRAWNTWSTIAVMYAAASTPFIVFFPVDTGMYPAWNAFEIIIYATFVIDVVVYSNLAYVNEDGILIKSRPTIMKHYAKTWMLVDLLAIIPLQ